MYKTTPLPITLYIPPSVAAWLLQTAVVADEAILPQEYPVGPACSCHACGASKAIKKHRKISITALIR